MPMEGSALLRAAAPARPQTRQTLPFISIIVPVLNEGAFIGETLTQLLEQWYDPDRFEILVVDGGSTDNTVDIVRRLVSLHANLRLLSNPGRLSSAGRNIAIQAAQGEIL